MMLRGCVEPPVCKLRMREVFGQVCWGSTSVVAELDNDDHV